MSENYVRFQRVPHGGNIITNKVQNCSYQKSREENVLMDCINQLGSTMVWLQKHKVKGLHILYTIL